MGRTAKFGDSEWGLASDSNVGERGVDGAGEVVVGVIVAHTLFGKEVKGEKFGDMDTGGVAGVKFGDAGVFGSKVGKLGDAAGCFVFSGIFGRKLGDVAKESVRLAGRDRPVAGASAGDVDGSVVGVDAHVVLRHTSSPSLQS